MRYKTTTIYVTHLQLIQLQQDGHRLCQSIKILAKSYCSCKNWATYNSCSRGICFLCDWEEHSSVIYIEKYSNIGTICD